jgi:DNA ligase 1
VYTPYTPVSRHFPPLCLAPSVTGARDEFQQTASGSRVFARFAIAAIAFIASLCAPLAQAEGKTAAPILLANVLAADVDPSNYLVSEKFDGVRAIWDGAELRFRSGRTVTAPTWFIDKLPKHKLDGELWLGRGKFEVLSGMVRKSEPVDDDWRQISYLIFELPDAPGSFEVRAARIREIVADAQ